MKLIACIQSAIQDWYADETTKITPEIRESPAFMAGFAAGERGEKRINPHPRGTIHYRHWRLGYHESVCISIQTL